jgi:RNA 3'-terminal phosphate cyclase-like protein
LRIDLSRAPSKYHLFFFFQIHSIFTNLTFFFLNRPLLLKLLPDIHVFTDACKGATGGQSPGYGLTLMAHTTSGVTYCSQIASGIAGQVTGVGGAEAAAAFSKAAKARNWNMQQTDGASTSLLQSPPEDMATIAAAALCDEIARGGVIPTALQPLAFIFMAFTSEDVSRLRIGTLGSAGTATLRLLRDVFGIVFRLQAEVKKVDANAKTDGFKQIDNNIENEDFNENEDTAMPSAVNPDVAPPRSASSILVSCLGLGFRNAAKKVS